MGMSEHHAALLAELIERIHDHGELPKLLSELEPRLLELLQAERLTLYRRSRGDREIVSLFKSGGDTNEIRVPLSNSSIAGHVALNQQPLRIDDVHDAQALARIHPSLQFDSSFDRLTGFRTRSMVVVPVKSGDVFLGVLQVLNHRDGGSFSDDDVALAQRLANVLGQRFRNDLQATSGPYDWLVAQQRLSRPQLDALLQRAKQERIRITDLLRHELGISAEEIGASLERYYQVPYMAYDPAVEIPRELLRGINEAYLRKQLWVPVAGDRDEVTLLIDDPSDAERIMEIQNVLAASEYVFRVGLPEDILRFLGQEIGTNPGADISELVGKLQEESDEAEADEIETQVDENEATVIQLVNRLIHDAYKANASDIHIEPGKGRAPSVVRLRVDGVCRAALQIPSTHIRAVVSRIKIMAQLDISERRKPQDGKLVVRFRGQPLELRVATIPTVNGESVVMRILAASEPLPLEKLSLSPRNMTQLENAIAHPHGIFLVVGPTGSGKTTTLHAVLGRINSPDRKIWTAEDPVEITQPGLQQVQVNAKTGFTFANALRAFLRADPDVIMIGEMRDKETAHAGVEASLTGHLVFSTLHTNSAAETVVRLLDLGLDPVSFADAFLGVLAQRLVRTLCPDCREPYTAGAEERTRIERYYGTQWLKELALPDTLTLHRAKGCDACHQTGYRGRVGIHELLTTSPRITDLIYHRATATELKQAALDEGMRTLMQDGITKLVAGHIDIEQLLRVVAE